MPQTIHEKHSAKIKQLLQEFGVGGATIARLAFFIGKSVGYVHKLCLDPQFKINKTNPKVRNYWVSLADVGHDDRP